MPRRRRRRDTRSPQEVLITGTAVALAFVAFIYFAVNASNGVPLRDYTTAYVTVPQSGNLGRHDPVRIAGVRVGQVMSLGADPAGGARIRIQLEPGTRVPANSTVAVRGNGLLGARYIQIIPGSASAELRAGATLAGGQDAYTAGVPETLDTLDAETRGALGTTLRELGTGLISRGDGLNDAIRISAPAMPRVTPLVSGILSREGAARELLPALDRASAALDADATDLARLSDPLATALTPLVSERAELRRTLDVAPQTLWAAHRGLTTGRRLLTAVHGLSGSLRRTLPLAPRALQATTTLLRTSHVPLTRTASLLRAARPAVPAALRITGALSPVLRPLKDALTTLGPMADRIGPYKCDIVNFATVFRSMTGFGGTGEGPNGPAMQFRLQAVAPLPGEAAGIADTTGLIQRAGYSRPCEFRPTTYPAVNPRTAARSTGR